MSLRVTQSNPSVTVQDAGRIGLQRYGVSPAGPMDWVSHGAANRLLGNDAGVAALEIGPLGATLQAQSDCRIAIAMPQGAHTKTLAAGEVLKLRPAQCNFAYIALPGGIEGTPVMGSQCMHRRSGIGGTHVAPNSLLLPRIPQTPAGPELMAKPLPATSGKLRAIKGPQSDLFSAKDFDHLMSARWKVSQRSDRMGLRLEGDALQMKLGADIVSDGIVTGAVQVPGDGHPILLMADRQTTGGYPKPLVVIGIDLPKAAQTPFGSDIQFELCTVNDAHKALTETHKWLNQLPKSAIQLAAPSLSSEDLLALNLIDGAISAT